VQCCSRKDETSSGEIKRLNHQLQGMNQLTVFVVFSKSSTANGHTHNSVVVHVVRKCCAVCCPLWKPSPSHHILV